MRVADIRPVSRYVLNGHPNVPANVVRVEKIEQGTVFYEYTDWQGQTFDMPVASFARTFTRLNQSQW